MSMTEPSITSNENKLSRGEREPACLQIEGFQSSESWAVQRLAVGCSDWLDRCGHLPAAAE
jgi:hypothetical protein